MTGESQDRSAGRRQRNLKTATRDVSNVRLAPTETAPTLATARPHSTIWAMFCREHADYPKG